jgi:hypothetical protein
MPRRLIPSEAVKALCNAECGVGSTQRSTRTASGRRDRPGTREASASATRRVSAWPGHSQGSANAAADVIFLLQYARLGLLIRTTCARRQWDEAAWPIVKHELVKALKLRQELGGRGGGIDFCRRVQGKQGKSSSVWVALLPPPRFYGCCPRHHPSLRLLFS